MSREQQRVRSQQTGTNANPVAPTALGVNMFCSTLPAGSTADDPDGVVFAGSHQIAATQSYVRVFFSATIFGAAF